MIFFYFYFFTLVDFYFNFLSKGKWRKKITGNVRMGVDKKNILFKGKKQIKIFLWRKKNGTACSTSHTRDQCRMQIILVIKNFILHLVTITFMQIALATFSWLRPKNLFFVLFSSSSTFTVCSSLWFTLSYNFSVSLQNVLSFFFFFWTNSLFIFTTFFATQFFAYLYFFFVFQFFSLFQSSIFCRISILFLSN